MKIPKPLGRVFGGLAVVFAGLLALVVAAYTVVDIYRSSIDGYLGTVSSRLVSEGDPTDEDYYPFKPKTAADGADCTDVDELIAYMQDVTTRLGEEGSVLLKNDGLLPLDGDAEKLALIGSGAYTPIYGGTMASIADESQAFKFIDELTAAGFDINPTVKGRYDAKEITLAETTVNPMSGNTTVSYPNGINRSISAGKYTVNESDPAEIGLQASDIREGEVGLVVISRPASEGGYYLPGADGMTDSTEWSGGRDVLGLSDNELANIKWAQQNCDRVLVIVNSAVAMDLPELREDKDTSDAENYGVDAVLWTGLPGPFGFRGVVDVIEGDASPSGHLADTYAVKASNSAAMVNYIGYYFDQEESPDAINWQTAEEFRSNANLWYLVEAEGIYTGYKYYETRYYDSIANASSNATANVGVTSGSAWNYANEVVWSFGYGMSYTTFTEEFVSAPVIDYDNETVTANVRVTNTGDKAGKHAVQLYMQAPYTSGGLEKPAIQLAAFGKTDVLDPDESVTLEIVASFDDIMAYDDALSHDNVKGGWVLEAGDYWFATGNGAHDALNNVLKAQGHNSGLVEVAAGTSYGDAEKISVTRTEKTESHGATIQNQLEDVDPVNVFGDQGVTELSRKDWQATWPDEYGVPNDPANTANNLHATEEMVDGLNNQVYKYTVNDNNGKGVVWGADHGLKISDLEPEDALDIGKAWKESETGRVGQKEFISFDDPRLQQLVEQITLEEAIQTTSGAGFRTIVDVTSINLTSPYWDDGPMGFDSTKFNNQRAAATPDLLYRVDADSEWANYTLRPLPTEVTMGATFNHELVQEAGEMIGNLAIWNGTSAVHVGANLHRTPYNARNHEYYSEDPVLMGHLVYDYCVGGSRYGIHMAPKHYALNDTEWNRNGLAVYMNEQRAREGELRCFQKAFSTNATLYTMTAFNRTGDTWCTAHDGLMRGILRGEWGWNGYVITDVAGNMYANSRDGIAATSDGILGFALGNLPNDDFNGTANSVRDDEAMYEDQYFQSCMQESVKRLCYFLLNSNYINGPSSYPERVYTWYDSMLIALEAVFSVLFAVTTVGGVVYIVLKKRDGDNA